MNVRTPLTGAAAGTAATAAMSLVMAVAKRAGWMGKQPPHRIVEAALDKAGVRRSRSSELGLAAAAHVGYGAASGAVFALLSRRLPPIPSGIAFGLVLWAASYLGWVPALGIMPPAHRDRPGRPAAMILAHVVYGAVLGRLGRRRG